MKAEDYDKRLRPCRTCGAAIAMVEGPSGSFIPVQRVTQIYTFPAGLPGIDQGSPKLELARSKGDFYISHFQTCPQAAEHSRRSS